MPVPYPEIEFETERLKIRAWRHSDVEAAFEIYGDAEVTRYLAGVPEESLESMRSTISRIIASYTRLDLGMGSFPLIRKDNGELIGAVLLKPLPRTEDLEQWKAFRDDPDQRPPVHEIEIGWHLRRDQWGKGFATEAAQKMKSYGFDVLKLDEIYAILYRENTSSAAVARRLEMRFIDATERFYGVAADLYVTP